MPTLNLDLNFSDHPKIKRLIARVGHEGVTCLLRLWGYAGTYHMVDGDLSSYTDSEIEQLAGWTGEHGALLEALLQVRLVDALDENHRVIHDWADHAGHLHAYFEKSRKMNNARLQKAMNYTPRASSRSSSSDSSSTSSSDPKARQGKADTLTTESKDSVAGATVKEKPKPERSVKQDQLDRVVEYLSKRYGLAKNASLYSPAGAIFKKFKDLGASGDETVWILENHCRNPKDLQGLLEYVQKIKADSLLEITSSARKNVGISA